MTPTHCPANERGGNRMDGDGRLVCNWHRLSTTRLQGRHSIRLTCDASRETLDVTVKDQLAEEVSPSWSGTASYSGPLSTSANGETLKR